MQYRNDRSGEPVSLLGYGCMRFTRKGGGIDLDKAERELLLAKELGVNYFDTAYIYPGSEEALGTIFERCGIRPEVKIATKLPQYMMKNIGAVERCFREELKRLRTDYIDYYLMHMITDISEWRKLEQMGIREWITEKKASGAIRNLGFSFHGNTEMFLQILDAYDWDFCQIQYNYLDEVSQAGRTGLQAAAEKGIPVIIMEPLRGGKLVSLLPEGAKQAIAEDPQGRSAAEIALRWLFDQKEVTCVLSGMNSEEMIRENCRIASETEAGSMTPEDFALVERLKAEIGRSMKVGCTGCGYCMPCPKGVDIPGAFRCYNRMYTEGKKAGRWEYFQTVTVRKEPAFPSQCIGCGKCEKHCPQGIAIREELKNADRALRPLPYRIFGTAARLFVMGGRKEGTKARAGAGRKRSGREKKH